MTFGSDSETAMSSMRPPMLAGPIERKRKLRSSGSSDWLIGVGSGGAAAGAGCWACGTGDRNELPRAAMAKASTTPPRKRLSVTGLLREKRNEERRPGIRL